MKEGWEIKKLGEVCDIICGQDYKSVKDDNGKYPIYGTGGIMGYASQYRCPANCVIIGRKGNINNPIYVETEFWNVDTAFGVVPKSEIIHPKFFYLFCKDYDFTKHDVSVTIPSLRRTDIIKIDVPIPPIAEQEKIVAELDCLSGIIEKKKQQLKEYDALAQSIFYEMFGDPVENEKGWECMQLKDACDKIGDGLHGTPQYDENGLIPFVNGTNLENGRIRITDKTQYVNEIEAQKFYIKMNDSTVLLSINGTLGKTALYKGENIIFGKSVCYCNLKNMLLTNFVIALMQTNAFKQFLEDNSSKSTIINVGLKAIRGFGIIIPPLALQQEFVSKIEAIEKQKALIKKSIEEVETLFNSRMDYYFN